MKKLKRIINQQVRARGRRLRRRVRRHLSPARVLIIVEAATLCALVAFALTGSRAAVVNQYGRHADLALLVVALALVSLMHVVLVRRVSDVITRRFLLEAYDERRILSDLGHAARGVTTVEQLFKLSVDTIQSALRTENVSIFVCDDETGDYACAISWPDGLTTTQHTAQPIMLARDAFVVKRLRRLGIPLGVGPTDFETWAQALVSDTSQVREARLREIATLECIKSRLLLQVMMKDHLVGIISLGPRPGNLPFSQEDKEMLMSVAGQMAFVIENAKLVERMVEEERLKRELTLATEVQRRLFPECPPACDSLDLSGFCQPARGVGGDYYDFLMLDDGQIGIAVADVAGKGISAAILMSIVQASLRSQAIAARGSLSDLVSTMNRLMYSSTNEASYATFFYAQFDPQARSLTYVNAGHNPPFLVRAASADRDEAESHVVLRCKRAAAGATGISAGAMTALLEVPVSSLTDTESAKAVLTKMLTSGGPVIGVFSDCVYEQETIQMQSGDVLVAYTDGVTEALNPEDEEFGECRLERVLTESAHLSAEEISSTIVERVRRWCGHAPQHDDLTFVVLKVK